MQHQFSPAGLAFLAVPSDLGWDVPSSKVGGTVYAAAFNIIVITYSSPAGLAFLAASSDLGWDVPSSEWHLYNGLCFLGEACQPGRVPAAELAQLGLRRFRAMLDAAGSSSSSAQQQAGLAAGAQPPLLSWGRPVLQQWQRLLLLEECACERDIASYSVFNVRLAAAVFEQAASKGTAAASGDDAARLRRYAITPWPMPPDDEAQRFTYRGPNLSLLLGPGRAPRLAVISVPGLPENRPGLVTGDVVYLRLASPITADARHALTAQLAADIQPASRANSKAQRVLQGFGSLAALGSLAPGSRQPLPIMAAASSLQLAGGVSLNLQQRLAVASLLCGGGVAAPYVLFGPPGTGKTVTLVEAVLQYRIAHPNARLLCCAPANYSADLLCSALARAGVTGRELLRLNDPRRPLVQAKSDTLAFCAVNAALDCFCLEAGLREAAIRPIVVCSTTTAGLLLPKPRKSAAIPIRAPGASAVPICTPGSAASIHGSSQAQQPAQQQQQLQPLLVPALQFDLVVVDEAGQGLAPEVLLPLSLAKPSDGDAPSYYNPQEVLVLAELLASLLGTPAAGAAGAATAAAAVSVNDIGVIATYRRQVQKIRLLLRQRGLGAVRVGTVDDYQGQEERIIFISTTLSKPESLPPPLPDVSAIEQQQHGQHSSNGSWGLVGGVSDVGFWRNPKRFNVAITRAKALLVVVGSPRVLAADDNWRQLLRHCMARGAYRGAGSSYLQQLLRVEALPPGYDQLQDLQLPTATAAGHTPITTNGGYHSPTYVSSHLQQQQQQGKAVRAAGLQGLLADAGQGGDDELQLALAVQAIAEAAQLGTGSAELLFPQTLDEYYAACEEEQPWKVAL
ncbi:hypothetical protein OEZ85_009208 [Tetradesmus obliquus]|uniref:RNA helicase n=1 Tax=Tetradesmus obliquus TaxID=3088 RepID=A0ABY8UB68_TETOB|nr:hypothetical protein OEZ85_009208 [Tetradesmus obliquus]